MVGSLIPAQSKVLAWSHGSIQLCGCSGKGQSAKAIIKASAIRCMGLEDIANPAEGDPGVCHAHVKWLSHKAME